MTDLPISEATRKNWERLQSSADSRLTRRANKQLSGKKVIPVEYFKKRKNIRLISEMAEFIAGHGFNRKDALYTIACRLLKKAGIFEQENVRLVLQEYPLCFLTELESLPLPAGENDLLGALYQCLQSEGNKNTQGSYYTPDAVARELLKGIRLKEGRFLDPCCGSGAFLLAVRCSDPAMLCGMDNDEIAVMLAKFNLLLKYPEQNFIPDIRCCDFLQENGIEAFDCIVTNPPWGAAGVSPCCLPEVRSGESFSLFFVKAFSMLKPGGTIRFLLPDAVMNVKKHQDLRKFLLEKCRLEEIMRFSARFSGVTSGTVGICCSKSPPRRTIRFSDGKLRYSVERQLLQKNSSCCFTMLELADAEILRAIRQKQKYTLADSRWALGIVTGSNREKLFTEPAPGLEKIYTGREVLPYVLAPHRFYIRFDRQELQQTAPEEYYRASEKLVYKFISSRPVFAYDNSGSLFLNSANILIPDVPGMSIKTVLAFLNSELFAYYCRKLFGDVKILKGDLMQLPFPEITADENRIMETLAEDMLNGADVSEILQEQIYRIFGMTPEQISRIRQSL